MRLCVAIVLLLGTFAASAVSQGFSEILFEDDFGALKTGPYSSVYGAHTEYHYYREAAPKGKWAVSTFRWQIASQRAWRVVEEDGLNVMVQGYENKEDKHYHPMVIAGDPLWTDYTVTVRFAPESDSGQSGLLFRYRNDRCYYFFGVEGQKAVLKMVRHATSYHKPYEKILAQRACPVTPGEYLTAKVAVQGNTIRAELSNGVILEAEDSTYPAGKIGLTSDVPTRFSHVKVTTSREVKARIERQIAAREQEEKRLQAENPKPVLCKRIKTEGFGVGRNLRFGDLNGDGEIDVLICQPFHHGPTDRLSEVGCLTAMTLDGDQLWQIGTPDPWRDHLTNDVAFQIHDLDNNGRSEVVYCKDFELVVADGRTGKTINKTSMPDTPPNLKPPYNRYPKILGDCLFFCDLRGTGHDGDIIVKNRYSHFWAYNDRLEMLWAGECNTGHYPYAYDVDGDGKDELAMGYSLFDDDGTELWGLDEAIRDHADGVAIVNFQQEQGATPGIFYAASDDGALFVTLKGQILKHHHLGHVQNPAAADLRADLPGLEIVSINFWANQGIVHFFDANGELYHDFEPYQYGSMCLPLNWTGRPEEYFVLAVNVEEGGVFDGWGRKVVGFPRDGHPDMCNAVLDITGDCRDEIVVWDTYELWVYTQDDNPKKGRLYKPVRNPLYNYSNYQATVSLPGWSE